MLPYFWYLLKVIICSGILLGYYWLFLRNKIFHQYNRFYLLMAMGLSLLLPLLKINFWQQHTETNGAILVLRAVSVGDEYMNSVVITAQKSFWNFQNLYPLLYWLVSLVFVFVLLRTLYIIRTLLKNYPIKQVEEVTFVNTNDDSTPFSFFKYIFWNSSIDMDTVTGRQIFKHEVAHIQEKHTYDKLFVNISLIFFWCNPFFWLYRKELNMIHEFIADKKAVEDSDTAAFAAMILQSAYPRHCFELTNNFFYSPIKRRLLMLTKIDNPRIGYFVRVMVLPLAILVFAAFTFKAKTNTAKEINGKNTLSAIEKNASSQSQFNTAQNNISIADTIPPGMLVNARFADSSYLYSDDFKNKALIIVDSKEIGNVGNNFVEEGIAKYSTVTIYNQTEAKKIYGVKGKYGVIKLTQKDAIFATAKSIYFDEKTKTIKLIGPDISLKGDLSDALINVEGKIITAEELKAIDPNKISVVSVLQGDNLNDIEDAKGKKSVIYISLKADDLREVIIKSKRDKEVNPFSTASTTDLQTEKILLQKNLADQEKQNVILEQQNKAKFSDSKEKALEDKKAKEQEILYLKLKIDQTDQQNKAISELDAKNVQGKKISDDQIEELKRKLNQKEQQNKAKSDLAEKTVEGKKLSDQEMAALKIKLASTEQQKKAEQDLVIRTVQGRKMTDKEMAELKQKIVLEQQEKARQDDNKVFTKMETPPQFIGGQQGWRDFLRKNLKVTIPVDSGASGGKYLVIVKFIVHTDGSVSDITCEKDPGYGTCEEVKRIIKESSKKWEPAVQNGRKVNAYTKQPVTFVIEE